MTLELFDAPIIPGIKVQSEFLGSEEENFLVRKVNELDLRPFRYKEWMGNRLTASFGWAYDFRFDALRRSEPIPPWLFAIRDRAASFAGLPAKDFVQVLVTRYDLGAGIGWHKDRLVYENVIGISMGEPATMRFRRRCGDRWERATLSLDPRGIYLLSGEARQTWEHGIAEMQTGIRYSITLRSFSESGREVASTLVESQF